MCSNKAESPDAIAGRLRELFLASLEAVNPGPFVRKELQDNPLASDAITLLALGKAAVPMAEAALEVLGEKVVRQCVVAPEIPPGMPDSWIASTHPAPSQRSVHAAQSLLDAASQAQGEVLFLLSGGGSALAALPAKGLALEAKVDLLDQVYAAGVAIDELNVVRKHLSAIKGGQLAHAATVPVTTLLVSDVVGDALHIIASGPTLPDPSTFQDALSIAESCPDLREGPALQRLREGVEGHHLETPSQARPGDTHKLLADFGALAEHAHRLASAAGSCSHLLSTALAGSVESVAKTLLESAKGSGLWIAGGEATVRLVPSPGEGGRAQHLALYLARELCGEEEIYVLVAGSDGIDGNTQVAGAIVDNRSDQRLAALGLDSAGSLQRCDSARALAAIDAQIVTGPTGVNHADLILLYRPG